jgi:hypothetical protein
MHFKVTADYTAVDVVAERLVMEVGVTVFEPYLPSDCRLRFRAAV